MSKFGEHTVSRNPRAPAIAVRESGTRTPQSAAIAARESATRTPQSAAIAARESATCHVIEPGHGAGKLVRAETEAAVKDTFMAIMKHLFQLAADAHGVGWLLRAGEWVAKVAEWSEVAEGDRQVNVDLPIPLGGIQVDVSAHIGHSPRDEEPPITLCFGPASGSDPGVLVVDGYEISPGDAIDKDQASEEAEAVGYVQECETEASRGCSVEDEGRVVQVELDLSELPSRQVDSQIRVAALMRIARDELVPALKQQKLWDVLEAAGVERLVYYDQDTKESLWLFLSSPSSVAVG